MSTCGTGGWNLPQPGDPDFNVILSASPVFGGIRVSWTYPLTNSHALAYTRVYRSLSGNDPSPPEIAIAEGNSYFDPISDPNQTTYYYWIRMVSIHGTESALIGPASSLGRNHIRDIIENLSNEITSSQLDFELQQEIAKITLNKLAIDQELLDRAAEDDALAASISTLTAFTDTALSALQQETLLRTTETTALSEDVNTLFASVGDNYAAIQQANQAIVDEAGARAEAITTVQSSLEGQIASVQITASTAISTANSASNTAGIAQNTANSAQNTALNASTQANNAWNLGSQIATNYMVKLDSNGYVSGFGLYNTGVDSSAIFNVDNFVVGKLGKNSIKPFMVIGNDTYINSAYITNLSADKITAGTLTGSTVQTAASGRRAVLTANTNDLRFYNSSNQSLAWIGEATFTYVPGFTRTTSAFFGDAAVRQIGVAAKGTDNGGYFYGSTGIQAVASSSAGSGVYGTSTSGKGVWGSASLGVGVQGNGNTGVYGSSIDNRGGYFTGPLRGAHCVSTSSTGIGVLGSASSISVAADGASWAFYGYSGNAKLLAGTWQTFTGAHEGLLNKNTVIEPGDILVDADIAGNPGLIDVICYNEPSTVTNQPALGVFIKRGTLPEPDGTVSKPTPLSNLTEIEYNNLRDQYDLIEIAGLGEGMINVCDFNGNITKGDLLITCPVVGKAAKQADDIVRSYTVARARESVDWSQEPNTTKQIACIYLCG